MTTHHRVNRAVCAGLMALAVASMLGGCRGDRSDKPPRRFFPDLDYQPRWNPQSETDFYADRRTLRQPDPHAVAFGRSTFDPDMFADSAWAASYLRDRGALLKDDDTYYLGVMGGADDFVDYMPVEVNDALIARGRDRYNIYCAACHGYTGDGKGRVGHKWSAYPADLRGGDYVDRAQRKGKDGYLFHTIRNGVWGPDGANKMPGYAHAVDEHDAWAIVSYLRVLQRAQGASLDDLSAGERSRIEAELLPESPPAEEPNPEEGGE